MGSTPPKLFLRSAFGSSRVYWVFIVHAGGVLAKRHYRSAGRDQRKMSPEDLAWSFHDLADGTKIGWDYWATDTVRQVKGVVCHGLALPPDVVKKRFYTNAKEWYPGL